MATYQSECHPSRAPIGCIKQHALNLMKPLNYPSNMRLGVPCLTKTGLDIALSLPDIDKLLSIKNPRTGKPLFPAVHYFGLSDVSNRPKLNPRLTLAIKIHNVDTSMDAVRTTAVFGYNKYRRPRIGTQIAEELSEHHIEETVKASHQYKNYTFWTEFHEPGNSPVFTRDIYDLINESNIDIFWHLFNELMSEYPMWKIDITSGYWTTEDMIQVAWQMVSQRAVDQIIFERLKDMNWEYFTHKISTIKEMSAFDKRYEAIKKLFAKGNTVPEQMPLRLGR